MPCAPTSECLDRRAVSGWGSFPRPVVGSEWMGVRQVHARFPVAVGRRREAPRQRVEARWGTPATFEERTRGVVAERAGWA